MSATSELTTRLKVVRPLVDEALIGRERRIGLAFVVEEFDANRLGIHEISVVVHGRVRGPQGPALLPLRALRKREIPGFLVGNPNLRAAWRGGRLSPAATQAQGEERRHYHALAGAVKPMPAHGLTAS